MSESAFGRVKEVLSQYANNVDFERRERLARELSSRMIDWRPIESFPKDGRNYLVWIPYSSPLKPSGYDLNAQVQLARWVGVLVYADADEQRIKGATHWSTLPSGPA